MNDGGFHILIVLVNGQIAHKIAYQQLVICQEILWEQGRKWLITAMQRNAFLMISTQIMAPPSISTFLVCKHSLPEKG